MPPTLCQRPHSIKLIRLGLTRDRIRHPLKIDLLLALLLAPQTSWGSIPCRKELLLRRLHLYTGCVRQHPLIIETLITFHYMEVSILHPRRFADKRREHGNLSNSFGAGEQDYIGVGAGKAGASCILCIHYIINL